MTLDALAGRLSPDVPQTLRRFPFAILLAALATVVIVANTTEFITDQQETWGRIIMGLGTAAIFATGGAIFAEGRPARSILGILAAYVLPLAVLAAWQVRDTTWLIPFALPIIGALWTSVAATTRGWRGAARQESQDRFWWLNHLAISSGAIVGIAFVVVLIGTYAIGQTVDTLFGFDVSLPLYRVALPVIGFFFAPLYWLSTLPRAADYQPGRLDAPDFLIRAVATIGKFILVPLLLAYSAILLLYAVQIVVTQQLPEGMLGWMVLGFVTTGAGAWLVLHPEFLRDSIIVRFFRRWWFWTTIVPLILYAVAVQVRLDAYGFTPERLLLVWGGLWAASLTLIFLLRRGDIRLIPIIAAICLLLATVGPWNVVGLSRLQQSATFDNLLPLTGPNGESYGITPEWTPEEDARARSAVQYLVQSEEGREAVREVVRLKGFDLNGEVFGIYEVMTAIGVPDPNAITGENVWLSRSVGETVDVGATPIYVGKLYLYSTTVPMDAVGLGFSVNGDTLRVSRAGETIDEISLAPHFASAEATLATPYIDFTVDGRSYRIVIESLGLTRQAGAAGKSGVLSHLDGMLFAGPIPPAPAPAAEPTAPDQPAPAT